MASHPGNVLFYFFKRFIYVFIWRGAQREREQQTPPTSRAGSLMQGSGIKT